MKLHSIDNDYTTACLFHHGDHPHDKFIKHRKSRCKLNWQLHLIQISISHHFLIIQKSQSGRREKEHCQNFTNLRFAQIEINLKILHHLQVNRLHSVITSKDKDKVQWWQSLILQFNSFMTKASHTETSPLISSANQWAAFYMITASVLKELSFDTKSGALAVREYIAIDTSLDISLPMIDMLFH